jgi:hypothetical protein
MEKLLCTGNINEFKQEKCSKLQTSRSLLLPLKKYWKRKERLCTDEKHSECAVGM